MPHGCVRSCFVEPLPEPQLDRKLAAAVAATEGMERVNASHDASLQQAKQRSSSSWSLLFPTPDVEYRTQRSLGPSDANVSCQPSIDIAIRRAAAQ